MRKIFLILIAFLGNFVAFSQQNIVVHQGDNVLLDTNVLQMQNIHFEDHNSIFTFNNGAFQTFSLSAIDSVTFAGEPIAVDKIHITFAENQVAIVNPFENYGVTISTNGANVSVKAATGIADIEYLINGGSSNGSITFQSDLSAVLTFDNLTLTNLSRAAIEITSEKFTRIKLLGTNALADGAGSSNDAPLVSKGAFVFNGNGSLQVVGVKKHGISSKKEISVFGGNFTITAASDGFHSEGFEINTSNSILNITAAGDGIDAGGVAANIGNCILTINSTANDVKGIKTDENLTINGANITMTIAGAQSKGLSSKKDIVVLSGNISITASGAAVLTATGSGYDPAYCTAVKADNLIQVDGGIINITSTTSANGGKGFSCDGDIVINGGNITITTAGDGAVYTNESGAKDSYTAACIKSNKNIQLLGGTLNCSSSGTGGKGITADGTITIGVSSASDSNLTLNVGTSGARFLVSGSTGGGGGWPPGGGNNADYANPKIIKCQGNLTVNSGTLRLNGTTEGGEGLESKSTLTINGGDINIHSYDDCINASTNITINGGTTYCVSTGNDGIDSNGTLTINGGFTLSNGTRSPEEGFDCDNNQFKITGGIIVGTGGATSNPTASACTQRAIKYTGTAGNAICIKNATGEIILLFQMPTYTGTGGGGGPGGGNSMIVLFTDPKLANESYTLQYGGTITGGTTVNGYNTGGSYSGGSTKSFTISSMLTAVN